MVRSLLGKSPKKEETSPKKEEKSPKKENSSKKEETLVEGGSSNVIVEQRTIMSTSDQVDTNLKRPVMTEPGVAQTSGTIVKDNGGEKVQVDGIVPIERAINEIIVQEGSPSSSGAGGTNTPIINGGSPPTAIPRIEVMEASLPSQIDGTPRREQVITVSNGLPKPNITPPSASSTSSPATASPSRIPSRQQPAISSTQHQPSSANSSQGHSPPGVQQGGDLKRQLGGQEELRKLESRIERFVSRSSGSECRCGNQFHPKNNLVLQKMYN